ncbi:phosphatase PAP2 family protein [Mucilaginibacter myungsuensis]|uniref:Phosphatase PAP2 family protein n=2 Tax=Mucilaginibacter myungsuensis TaxID=649104 RepID=A0A929KZ10_9SPHI|nr:phosphatase PAP2 family protein [Mucilaginibacter myungsuensis]
MLLMTFPGKAMAQQSSIQQWDDRIMIDLASHRTPKKTGFYMFMSNSYKYGEIGIPAGMFIGGVISNDQQLRQNALYVASSTAITIGATALIKLIVKRPRPFIKNIKIIPVYEASYYSFPSGHTSSTMATATAVSIAYPKWYVIAPSFLWAGTVGYSRSYLGVHYPTDVGAGALLGAGTAVSMSFMKKP